MTQATDPTQLTRTPLGVVAAGRQQRVLVVDDSPITRAGLCSLVDGLQESCAVGAVADAHGAAAAMRHLVPDVALVNVRTLTAGGLAMLSRSAPSRTAVVVLRTPASMLTVDDAVDARVNGLVDLDVVEEDLRIVLDVTGAGHSFCLLSDKRLSNGRRTQHDSSLRSPLRDCAATRLTTREQQVLELVARGLSNRQVASNLRISEGTVKKHVTRLLGKLNVQSRTQAALTVSRRSEPEPAHEVI